MCALSIDPWCVLLTEPDSRGCPASALNASRGGFLTALAIISLTGTTVVFVFHMREEIKHHAKIKAAFSDKVARLNTIHAKESEAAATAAAAAAQPSGSSAAPGPGETAAPAGGAAQTPQGAPPKDAAVPPQQPGDAPAPPSA